MRQDKFRENVSFGLQIHALGMSLYFFLVFHEWRKLRYSLSLLKISEKKSDSQLGL